MLGVLELAPLYHDIVATWAILALVRSVTKETVGLTI